MTALRILALSTLSALGAASACGRTVPGLHLFQRARTADLSQEAPWARALRDLSQSRQPAAGTAGAGGGHLERGTVTHELRDLATIRRAGNPLKSPLLLHPLAMAAGGDHFHAGGKHWKSQSDPEWQTLADWVNGRTIGGSK